MHIQPFFARFLEGQEPAATDIPSSQPGQQLSTFPDSLQTRKYPSDTDFADIGTLPYSGVKPNRLVRANPLGIEAKPSPWATDPNPLGIWTRPNPLVQVSKGRQDTGGSSSGSIHTMAFPSDSDAMEGRLRF